MADLLVESLHLPFIGHLEVMSLIVRGKDRWKTVQGLLLPPENLGVMNSVFGRQLAQGLLFPQ